MRQGLPWYRREPRAFLEGCRAAKLTERQVAVYSIVLDMIYDQGGETPDDPKHISSYFADTGAAAVRNAIQQLVDIGKLFRVGDMLHQKRAENEAETREKLSENRAEIGRKGGISSGNSRRASSKINRIDEANASSKTEADKIREEKEEREANASPKKIGKLDALGVVLGIEPGTPAWSGGASAEAVMLWMALGLTQLEIAKTAKLWPGPTPPAKPSDLDELMNAAAAEKRKPKTTASKATSLPQDWFLPKSWGQWAFNEGMPITEIRRQADIFKDYWLGIAGTVKGRKADWEATWRNWVRKRLSEMPRGDRNGDRDRVSETGKRADPALEQIARLAGLGEAQGDGRGGAGGGGEEDGSLRLGP